MDFTQSRDRTEAPGAESVGWPAIASDIADQQGVDRRLREREAWFAEAQAVAHVGSWSWDVPADEVTWSPEFYEMLGIVPGTVRATYKGFIDLIHPDDRAAAEGALGRALAGGDTYAVAHRLIRADGGERMMICRGRVYRDPDGAPLRMVGASLDLTDYMGVAEDLRTSHSQLLAAEELAGVGSFECNLETGAVTWSEGMYRIFGLRHDEFDGTVEGYLHRVHPEDRDQRRAEIAQVISERSSLESASRIRRGDKSFLRIRSRVEVEPDASGCLHLMGVCWEEPVAG